MGGLPKRSISERQQIMVDTDLQSHVLSPKLNLKLAPEMRADEAVRVIMRRLLEMMNTNEAGVSAGKDIECLHNFRIAVRRNRSLLGQVHGIIPQHEWQRFTRGFAWLGVITRSARDIDVYLLSFEDYTKGLGAVAAKALDPLREFILHQQQQAHQQLVDSLKSARYSQLMAVWATFLASPLSSRSRLPNAKLPVLDLANQRIWRMLRRVIRQGTEIDADSPPQALHELRKSCKKLRYLIEFFQSFYPADRVRKAIKALKSLQDMLGEYQDLQVQQEMLKNFVPQMAVLASEKPCTLAAVDRMMRKLAKRQLKVRKMFKQRFARFIEEKHQKVFRQLFKSGKAIGP